MSDLPTIIAGSRDLGIVEVRLAMARVSWDVGEVICGCALGVDRAGQQWERETFPGRCGVRYFPAWESQRDWALAVKAETEIIDYPPDGYGRGNANGILRNYSMARYANEESGALVAVWDGSSDGTGKMIEFAEKRGLKTLVWTPE